jgi:phage-related protein (TIGR01555 family)
MPPRTLGASEDYQLAMDAQLEAAGFPSLLSHAFNLGMGYKEIAPQFLGYPYLAGLSQNPIIRAGVSTVAEEMTKRWLEIRRGGKAEPGDEKIKALNSALQDFGVKELFNQAAQKCDFEGGCLLYIDTGDQDNLELPLFPDRALIQGRLQGFVLVDAINLYPGRYNATDPLAPDFFRPQAWMVQGRLVHHSRFLYFAPNQVSLLLKPAYNFFGIPAAQSALDYVAHFNKTREAAHRLLTKFSLTVFKSNVLASILAGGESTAELEHRMRLFTQYRDNDSVLLIDKESEDVVKLETPLSGVTDIVRQSLEFVAAIFRIPFVKFLGISPGGLNATGESDLRNFYDHVSSKQEKILRRPLDKVLDILQLHLFGEIDPEIKAEFVPLAEEDAAQKAATQKTQADMDGVLLDRGVLSPGEVRQRLADNPASGYGFIDPELVPCAK